jgi:predicted site-specific integrase-resolvase
MSYVNAAKAAEYYNVCTETLRVWAKSNKIEFVTTTGGHRRYKLPDKQEKIKHKYLYARVSSAKQSENLQSQIKYLRKKYPNFEVISDIGSGLNFKRKGFRRILEQLFSGDIEEVIISSTDRFSRFGTRDFFCWLFEHFGGKLTILNNKFYANPNEELSEDLLEIITVFSARYYGRRNYTDNKKN